MGDCCGCNDIKVIELIKDKVNNKLDTKVISEFFKVIGDETRLKILIVLFENTICVNDIANILGMTKSAISHQLKILKDHRHIRSTKVGKSVYYTINDEHVVKILQQAINHLEHE